MKPDQNVVINWKHVGCIVASIAALVGWHVSHVDARFEKIDKQMAVHGDRLTRIEVNHGERLARIEGILGERASVAHGSVGVGS